MPVFRTTKRLGGCNAYSIKLAGTQDSEVDSLVLVLMDEPENDSEDYPEINPLDILDDNEQDGSASRLATWENVVSYAVTTEEDRADSFEILLACPSKPSHDSTFLFECLRLLNEVQPDVILLSGYRVSKALFGSTWASRYGFLWKSRFEASDKDSNILSYKCRATVTVPVWGITSPFVSLKGDDEGGFVNLIGQFVEHLQSALRGKSRYRINVPKPEELVIDTVDTMDKFLEFYNRLLETDIPCFDTETESLGRKVNRILTFQFLLPTTREDGWYDLYFIPFDHDENPWLPEERTKIKNMLRRYFESATSDYVVGAGLKFDIIQVVNQLDVRWFNHRIYDIQSGVFVEDENRKFLSKYLTRPYNKPYALDFIERTYGYVRPISVMDKEDRVDMASKTLEEIKVYGMLDVVTPHLIRLNQIEEAKRRGYKMHIQIVTDQLGITINEMAFMEARGMLADADHLQKMTMPNSQINGAIQDILNRFKTSEAAIRVNDALLEGKGFQEQGMFGKTEKPWLFDFSKKEHTERLFFEELRLEPIRIGKSGAGSLDKGFQEAYNNVPEVSWMSDLQRLLTVKQNFIDTLHHRLVTETDALSDGRIRPTFDYRYVLTGRSCLAGDTPIYVLDERGSVGIKDINPGDWVWSFNVKTMLTEPYKVLDKWCTGVRKTIRVSYRVRRGHKKWENRVIDCTADHLFLNIEGKYVEAQNLLPGDRIQSLERSIHRRYKEERELVGNSNNHEVVCVSFNKGVQPVYDLEVDKNSNFIANGCCVHNSSRAPNSQNQPSRGKLAKIVKAVWIAPLGKAILKPDFNAHEIRGFGIASFDPVIKKVFNIADKARIALRLASKEKLKEAWEYFAKFGDVHIQNVKFFFGQEVDKKHPLRNAVKSVGFGVIYGKGAKSLALGDLKGHAKKRMDDARKQIKEIRAALEERSR